MARKKRRGDSEVKIKVCPRCGNEYSYLEYRKTESNTYVYAVHEVYIKGKGRQRWRCYLGPIGRYKYSNLTNPFLNLRGLSDPDRVYDYVTSLLNYIEGRIYLGRIDDFEKKKLELLAQRMRKTLELIESIFKEE